MSEVAAKSEAAADGDGADKAGAEVATPKGPAASGPVSPKAAKGEDAVAETKSDSEAETVVLPGKDDATASPRRRAIKHEGNGRPSKRVSEGTSVKKKGTPDRDGEGRSKKVSNNHTATSSNLSSTRSSPVPEARASSRAGSESLQSKSKGHADSDSVSRTSQTRKRKIASEETDDKSHKRRQKRDGSLENATGSKLADGDRRDKSKSHPARSESPQPHRTRNRAQSFKGSIGTSTISTTQRRKKPPPLTVSSRGKNDEESGSDGSASPPGGPHLKRLVSGEGTATSPAKLPPHKKLLDRNGRTWLARACDSEDAQVIRDRLQERPEELDIADYAQNTPLQIASLKGRHEIVKVLLEAGCKTDVKNIDQDTPLIDAVENGHLKVIRLLLGAGVNPRQSNAEGEDVMDLLDPEIDDYEDIKKLLTKARESRRRTSDDPHAPSTGKESSHTHSPREASLNSPPPLPTGGRRRTARSEATRNDLLWVNATSQNLQNKARVGDDAAVDHILNMNPGCADIYSVLAATRGSHEVSLSLILAIGRPPADPDPIPGERSSQSTPMLAAIGRGNLRVIEQLLEQPGFDPTRRLYQNKPYHEISKDRRGPQWDDEYRLLKRAYDKAKGRPSSGSSPSTTKKSKAENAGSPNQERTKSQSDAKDPSKDVAVRKKPSDDRKNSQSRTDEKSPERSRQHTRKHLRVPSKPSSREASVAVSDREASPLRKSGEKKSRRSHSDAEETEAPKPTRKRLVSRRDLTEGDRQRRASMVSVGSASGKDDSRTRLTREVSGSQKIKREDSRLDSKSSRSEAGKKRTRPETTTPEEKSRDSPNSPDAAKKAKRLRVDADNKPKKDPDGSSSRHKSPGRESGSVTVGSSKSRDSTKAAKDLKSSSRRASPAPSSLPEKSSIPKIKEEEPDDPSSQLQKEAHEAAEAEKKDRVAKKEAERAAQEEAEAKEAEARKREEAERKEKAEKEEAERQAQAAKEEAERKAREEEEARLEKKRQEEEQARKLAERERLRKEQEELQARRRKEQEEKERQAREKKQQEEERRRRELLPNALRIAAELGPDQAKQPSEVRYWLPLYTAEGHQLDPSADDASKRELWVTNIQAAPVLGVTDLDLSQYTAWSKRSANDSQRMSLWRILRRKLARYQAPKQGPADHQEEFRLDAETHEKFDALKNIFWIRLSDLLDIVPRYPHLTGIDLKCSPMAIRPGQKTEPGAHVSPTTIPNGLSGRPNLPNGFH